MWIALFILSVILIILLLPIKISAKFAFSQSSGERIFLLELFGFTIYRSDSNDESRSEPEDDKPDKTEEKCRICASDVKAFIHSWQKSKASVKKDIKKILKNLKRLANLKKAELFLHFGFDDAAQTGILSGILYGFVYGIFSTLYNTFNINKKNMKIDLSPEFNKQTFELYAEFGFKVRIIFSLFIIFWILKLYFLLKKEAN